MLAGEMYYKLIHYFWYDSVLNRDLLFCAMSSLVTLRTGKSGAGRSSLQTWVSAHLSAAEELSAAQATPGC